MGRELERRFLCATVPDGEPVSETLIRQAYWRLGDGWSFRLRRIGEDPQTENWIAVKGPRQGSERWEFEYPMTSLDMADPERADSLNAVLNLYRAGSAHTVVKKRKGFVLDGRTWDVDEFLWDNEGLVIAEIEAHDERELFEVAAPSWVQREVTLEARYNNENLAYEPYKSWTV